MSILIIVLVSIVVYHQLSTLEREVQELKNTTKREIDSLWSFLRSSSGKNHQAATTVEYTSAIVTADTVSAHKQHSQADTTPPNSTYVPEPTVPTTSKDSAFFSDFEMAGKAILKNTSHFEKLFLGNLFNKIGAIALIIGMGLFIKFISRGIIFTPTIKVILGILAGLGLIFTSVKLHKNKMKHFAEVLMGTGFAVIFVAIYCGVSFYYIIPESLASILGMALVLAAYRIAERYKTFSTLLIGLFGGYLNPFFINSDISTNFLFGYLLFVNLVAIAYVLRNTDKTEINVVNITASVITISIFATHNHDKPYFLYPLLLWGLYIAYDILLKLRLTQVQDKNHTTADTIHANQTDNHDAFNWFNLAVLVYFAWFLFSGSELILAGWIVFAATAVYPICEYCLVKYVKTASNFYIPATALALLVAELFILDAQMVIYMLSAETVLIALLVKHFKSLKSLESFCLLFLMVSIVTIFFVPDILVSYERTPIFNIMLPLLGAPALAAFFVAGIFSHSILHQAFKFIYLSLIYAFAFIEFNNLIMYLSGIAPDIIEIAANKKLISLTGNICIAFAFATQMKSLHQISSKKSLETFSSAFFGMISYATYFITLLIFAVTAADYTHNFYPLGKINFNLWFLFFWAVPIGASYIYAKMHQAQSAIIFFKFISLTLAFAFLATEATFYFYKLPLYMTYVIILSMYTAIIALWNWRLQSQNMSIFLRGAIAISYIVALLILASCGLTFRPIESFTLFFNVRCLAFISVIAVSVMCARYARYLSQETSNLYTYMAAALGLILVYIEMSDFSFLLKTYDTGIMISIACFLYACTITSGGIFKDVKALKTSGIIMTLMVIAKVLLIDMANADTVYKIIAYLVLGVILLLVSYYYSSKR